jgi:hypothetical protein
MISPLAGMNVNYKRSNMYICEPTNVEPKHKIIRTQPMTAQDIQDAMEKGKLIAQYKQFWRRDILEQRLDIPAVHLDTMVNRAINGERLRDLTLDELREKLKIYRKNN